MTPIISGLVIGTTYTAHVVEVPSGYTAPDDKSTLISNASLHTVKLVVSKTADSNVNTGDSTDVFTLGLIGFMSLAALIGLSSKRKES